MANSYLNIVTFLLTTLFYYLALKPSLTYEKYTNQLLYKDYVSNNYMYLAIYLLLIIIIQFVVNSTVITDKCGGNISNNIGVAGVLTFIPWILIFGMLVLVLMIFPGFKSAFADVVGYYYVSGDATKILTELLVNQDVQNKLTADPNITLEQKEAMETAADVIIKICGNTSILINQIVPSNFQQYWQILKPLMKDKYKEDNAETTKIRDDLFKLVVSRDNVGEAMWYIYTGLLLTSIVQLKITNHGCVTDTKTMEENYNKFLKEQEKAREEQAKAETTYTITT